MKTNLIVNPSKAALGVLAATLVPAGANAQEANTGVTLSFEAGIGSTSFASDFYDEKLGSDDFADDYFIDEFDNASVFTGSVALSGAVMTTWDWKISATRTQYGEVEATVDDFDTLDLKSSFEQTQVGATVGRSFDLGVASARIGFGLAYADAEATTEKGFPEDRGPDGRSNATAFSGFGGRITVDAESGPLSADGRLSAIGGGEFNLYSGEYETSASFEFDDDDFERGSFFKYDGTMATSAIYAGAKYAFSQRTDVRFGVRYDLNAMEVQDDSIDAEIGDTNALRSSATTAFIGMDIKF